MKRDQSSIGAVAIIHESLGEGTPLLLSPGERARLRLVGSRVYEKTGIVSLEYAIDAVR